MISAIVRVTKDLEPQTTNNGKDFVNVDVAENKGFGENARTQYHRCTIWGKEQVDRIVKAKVKKGSLIFVVGDQDLSAYPNKSTGELCASSNITVWHWEYVQGAGKKSDDTRNAASDSDDGLPYIDTPTEDCMCDLPE